MQWVVHVKLKPGSITIKHQWKNNNTLWLETIKHGKPHEICLFFSDKESVDILLRWSHHRKVLTFCHKTDATGPWRMDPCHLFYRKVGFGIFGESFRLFIMDFGSLVKNSANSWNCWGFTPAERCDTSKSLLPRHCSQIYRWFLPQTYLSFWGVFQHTELKNVAKPIL